VGALWLSAGSARAAAHDVSFRICNQTSDAMQFVLAYHGIDSGNDNGLTTEGYWSLAAGKCSDPITRKVVSDESFIWGSPDVRRPVEVRGDIPLCIGENMESAGFTLPNADTTPCNDLNQIRAYFRPLTSLAFTGGAYVINSADVSENSRAFNVCNDTGTRLHVAVGFTNSALSNDLISRGWETVYDGQCYLMATTDGSRAYVRAYDDGGDYVLGGDQPLCTWGGGRYFTFSQATAGACSGQDEARLGFLAVDLTYPHMNLLILGRSRTRHTPTLRVANGG